VGGEEARLSALEEHVSVGGKREGGQGFLVANAVATVFVGINGGFGSTEASSSPRNFSPLEGNQSVFYDARHGASFEIDHKDGVSEIQHYRPALP
jgi:hypothetical protein